MKEPNGWKTVYTRLKEFRATIEAPVDIIGCDKLFTEGSQPKTRRFQILVSLLLSSQTKDQVTAEAMRSLHAFAISEGYQEGLTVDCVLKANTQRLNDCISKVGFHRKKTQYLQQVAATLSQQYENDIPSTAAEIMQLPGIGPKMAYLAVQTAWGRNEGIGVDTHVHRIASRLRWVPRGTEEKGPEATRAALEGWLPKDFWPEINPLLVGLGQTVCTPLRPRCAECALNDLCPSSSSVKQSKLKAKKADEGLIVDIEDCGDVNQQVMENNTAVDNRNAKVSTTRKRKRKIR